MKKLKFKRTFRLESVAVFESDDKETLELYVSKFKEEFQSVPIEQSENGMYFNHRVTSVQEIESEQALT